MAMSLAGDVNQTKAEIKKGITMSQVCSTTNKDSLKLRNTAQAISDTIQTVFNQLIPIVLCTFLFIF
jgi:hypothetical protein